MKHYNCIVCNKSLTDEASIELGVGSECLKKDLVNLPSKTKSAMNNALRATFNEDFTGAKIRVKNDYIAITFYNAERVVDLHNLNAANVRAQVETELNDIITNPEKTLEIKTLSAEAMQAKFDEVMKGDTTDLFRRDLKITESMAKMMNKAVSRGLDNVRKDKARGD